MHQHMLISTYEHMLMRGCPPNQIAKKKKKKFVGGKFPGGPGARARKFRGTQVPRDREIPRDGPSQPAALPVLEEEEVPRDAAVPGDVA
jgi:hypothetical protein